MTAVSLATTLSLPAKVRLLIACTASNTPPNRRTGTGFAVAEAMFTAVNGQGILVLYGEILLHSHSPSTDSRYASIVRKNYIVYFLTGFFFCMVKTV